MTWVNNLPIGSVTILRRASRIIPWAPCPGIHYDVMLTFEVGTCTLGHSGYSPPVFVVVAEYIHSVHMLRRLAAKGGERKYLKQLKYTKNLHADMAHTHHIHKKNSQIDYHSMPTPSYSSNPTYSQLPTLPQSYYD